MDSKNNITTTFTTVIADFEMLSSGCMLMTAHDSELTKKKWTEHFEVLELYLGKEKRNYVLEVGFSDLRPIPKDVRDHGNKLAAKFVRRMGVVVTNPLLYYFVKLYQKLSTLEYGMEIFHSFEEAEKWAIAEDE